MESGGARNSGGRSSPGGSNGGIKKRTPLWNWGEIDDFKKKAHHESHKDFMSHEVPASVKEKKK